jgi:monothiol glutaredoxin
MEKIMELDPQSRQQIEDIVSNSKVVLFMKGTPAQPQCGFSAASAGILDSLVPQYSTVNVLEDPTIRDNIKTYSNWPTIPQLYIDGEFLGGCDIIKQMFNSGELHETLGMDKPDRTPPEITLSDAAVETIQGALEQNQGVHLQLSIDARWEHNFALAPAEGNEIRTLANGIEVLMDVATAQKAKGLKVDIEDTLQGKAFRIDNPNAPVSVAAMSVQELKSKLEAGEALRLYDVRPEEERAKASLEGSTPLWDEGNKELESLDKNTPIVFLCHTGQRSQAAAEHYRLQGFTQIYNLSGGIDAWSKEIDSQVPLY